VLADDSRDEKDFFFVLSLARCEKVKREAERGKVVDLQPRSGDRYEAYEAYRCDGQIRRPKREILDGGKARRYLRGTRDIVNVVAQGDEEVEEELGAAVEHLKLHGATSLECAAAAYDEGKIVGTKLGVGVGSISIGVSGRGKDGAGLNSRLCCV
jgi:hypothetical protein